GKGNDLVILHCLYCPGTVVMFRVYGKPGLEFGIFKILSPRNTNGRVILYKMPHQVVRVPSVLVIIRHFNLIFNLVQSLIDAVGYGIGSRFTRGYILIFHQKSVVKGAVKGFVDPEFGNGKVSGVCYLNGFKFLTSVHDWTGTYHPGYFK